MPDASMRHGCVSGMTVVLTGVMVMVSPGLPAPGVGCVNDT